MSYYNYRKKPALKPKETRAGIRSKAVKRKNLPSNWWSLRWIEALGENIDSGRMSRAKTYARKGQVVDIDISCGLVTASVQGSGAKPYKVKLTFPAADKTQEALIFERFKESASFAAELLAGEMPRETEDIFKEAELPLFLDRRSMLSLRCSCPDSATLCKHIAAVLILLAEVIDDDPFLLLKIRGIDKEKLMDTLTSENVQEDENWFDDLYAESDYTVTGGSDVEDPSDISDISQNTNLPLDESWYGRKVAFPLREIGGKDGTLTAIEVMTDFPFWRGGAPFKQMIKPMYERARDMAFELLTDERDSLEK